MMGKSLFLTLEGGGPQGSGRDFARTPDYSGSGFMQVLSRAQ